MTKYNVRKLREISLLLLLLGCSYWSKGATGFVSVRSVANATRHTFMTPLRVDTMLFTSSSSSSSSNISPDGDVSSSPPSRGVVINTSVGSLVVAGGIMGFVKAGSKASLIAGSTFGGLLFVSAVLIRQGQVEYNNNSISGKGKVGNLLGGTVAAMLGKTMGKKFLKSGKFIPSGLIAMMSTTAAIYNIIELIRIVLVSKQDKQEPIISATTTTTTTGSETSSDAEQDTE